MSRSRVLWALLATVGCGDVTPPPSPAQVSDRAAQPRGPVLRVGDRHVYDLTWTAEASRRRVGASVAGALTLEGVLAVAVLSTEQDGTRLSLSLPRVDVAALKVQDQTMPIDPLMLVGPRAEILVDADGDVRRAFFERDAPPIFRELMSGVIARLDLRGAAPDEAPREIRTGHGLVEASYRATSANAVARELRRVVRFDTAPDVAIDPSTLRAEGLIQLDADRVPVAIELHDGVALPGEEALVSDDHFSLVRAHVERADERPLVDPVELDPLAAPNRDATARELDRQLADGYAVEDISIALTVASGGLQPPVGEFSRAAALLRAWPERATQLLPLVMATDEGGRQLAFDMLAAAGTPEAQTVMLEVMSSPQWASWPERIVLVQRFSFVDTPTHAAAEALLAMLDEANTSGDRELGRATLHTLGVVADRVADPWMAERIHARLVALIDVDDALLRAGAVAGLGNARRRDDMPRLLVAMLDDASGVRLEAASAMRFWVSPDTTAALLDALGDENPAVGAVALDVLRKRHFEGEADTALIERARDGRYHPELEAAIASSLLPSADEPAAASALAAIGARTPDRRLARRLAAL
ncbi:MAG: hypothetical protein IPK74_36490 [Deltaproteobacteria bacterium]|nr:hypothetical protein [Deltaproteobacteria bacterium]